MWHVGLQKYNMTDFTPDELLRYSRQFSLPQVGLVGQKKLKDTAILCIGAGGIGSPVLSYLVAAGVGKVGIIDDDVVDLSNLQRQILYSTAECGLPKVSMAKKRLLALNDQIEIVTYQEKITRENALERTTNYQLVIDGSDNYVTRYLVNDACQINKVMLISASLFQFSGQLIAFDFKQADVACYRCLYPTPPPAGLIQNCADAGIFGAVAGILGTFAATAAIQLACAMPYTLKNQLLVFNSLNFDIKKYYFSKNHDCALCGLNTPFMQLDRFDAAVCSTDSVEISAEQLSKDLQQNKDVLIVDVRQDWERLQGYIANSLHSPLSELEKWQTIPENFKNHQAVVLYCAAGVRSLQAVKLLQRLGLTHVYSLKGGFK